MKVAFKFGPNDAYCEEGYEPVIYRAQMLRDVYYHEGDPLPNLVEFLNGTATRPNDQDFWVYRQGTFIDSYLIEHGELYIGAAKTSDLDASPKPTFEGYHHVPTMQFGGGGKFSIGNGENYLTRRQNRLELEELLEGVKNYGR